MEAADFSGYATKAGLKCSDGRTITAQAFQHMDGMKVPLVWQHGHDSPDNVLGHGVLQARQDGMYVYGFFNDTPQGRNAKALVQHEDIKSLSIWANQLVEKAKQVLHGMIREVSLVLSGANPGALIDFIALGHGEDAEVLTDEAIIYTGLELQHAVSTSDPASQSGMTIQQVYDTMNQDQKNVLHYMVGAAAGLGTIQHSDETPVEEPEVVQDESDTEERPEEDSTGDQAAEEQGTTENTAEGDLNHQEGTNTVTRNVFDQSDAKQGGEKTVLSHAERMSIVADAKKPGMTLKAAVEAYALSHGIDDIDVLFPDARSVDQTPQFDKRRTEWVDGVLNGTRHSPFSRIKSLTADLTLDEARAKGYVKGNLKKEEFFRVSKRTTSPQTIYKKQKLDRDDIVDIVDFDVVAWLKAEMRMMLNEEIARAVLIGDGREVDDDDKIQEDHIRPIATDDDLYAATVYVNLDDASSSWTEFLDEVLRTRRLYKGTGTPDFYTTELVIGTLMTLRDANGNRMFRTMDELTTALRVNSIVSVEVMEDETDLIGIMVNLADYTLGADRGGEVSFFDDFDIDYNQFKYLYETRLSGALTKIRSALVYRKVGAGAALVVPAAPTQDDDEVTIVTTTGATYKIGAFTGAVTYNSSPVTTNLTVTSAHPIVIPDGGQVTVYAIPTSSSYYFETNVEDEWTFDYNA